MIIKRDDLLLGPYELAKAAIKAGDTAAALKYLNELRNDFKPVHDNLSDWIQSLLNYIGENMGEGAVEKALLRNFDDVFRGRTPPIQATAEETIRKWCRNQRAHYSQFHVDEDEDKYTIVITNCGSGGRHHRPDCQGKTKQPNAWTGNSAGAPYYCLHEPVFEDCAEKAGLSSQLHEYLPKKDDAGNITGCECRRTVQKSKADITA